MSEESIAFDRAVEYYDETRGFPPGVAAQVAAFLGRQLPSQGRILEVGIGTGRIALPVASHVDIYYGIDLSLPMLERLHAKRDNERIYFAQADAMQLPIPDYCVDAVVTVHVFDLISNWRQALAEVARVLRPDGYLLNCYEDFDEHPGWRILITALDEAMPLERHRQLGVDYEQNKGLLSDQGWQRISEVAYGFQKTITPRQFISGLRRRILSSWWTVSDADLAAGIAAVERVIDNEFDSPDAEIRQQAYFRVQAYLPPESGTA